MLIDDDIGQTWAARRRAGWSQITSTTRLLVIRVSVLPRGCRDLKKYVGLIYDVFWIKEFKSERIRLTW